MTKYKVEFKLTSGLVASAIKPAVESMFPSAVNIDINEVEE